MIHRHRIAHHFLPHFYVERDIALKLYDANSVHHRAHALSLGALFAYLHVLVFITAAFYFLRLSAPQILGQVTFSAEQIVTLTNEKRVVQGLTTLAHNALLAQAASAKAADMFANDYWAHNSPSGRTPWSFITAAGYKYIFAGENLARDFNDPKAAVDAWMDSPSHRSNLLDKNFREIGVAVSSGKLTGREGILVVQMFGTSVQLPIRTAAEEAPVAAAKTPSGPEPTPAGEATPQVQTVTSGPETEVTVLAGRQFSIAKGISLALVGFIFLLFLLEVLVTAKRAHVSLKPGVLAHLAVLGFILFAVWYAVGGAIL